VRLQEYTVKYNLNTSKLNKNKINEYKLYAYLSNLFNDILIIDVGTFVGNSALAFANNERNRVITFDINDHIKNKDHKIYSKNNIQFKLDNFMKYEDLIKTSSMMLIDISPHNGINEQEILDFLAEVEYKGLLIFDDIAYFKGMISFWNNIKFKKYNISSVGHWSGTGIVDIYNNHNVKIMQGE